MGIFLPLLLMILNVLTNGTEGKEKILESRRILDRGTWGPWAECPAESYAMGFQQKIDAENGNRVDNTALNGITLFCAKLTDPMIVVGTVTSSVGQFGVQRTPLFCDDGFVIGFDLKVYIKDSADLWGATNLRAYCSNLRKNKYIQGDGLEEGEWGGPKMCRKFQAVCAMRTQVQPYKDKQDDTSLNNVDMRCCDIPTPAKTCKPSDKFVDLVTCDNLGGVVGSGPDFFLNCTYSQTVGVSSTSTTTSSFNGEMEAVNSLGFGAGGGLLGLQANLKVNLESTSTTGVKWGQASTETYSKETTRTAFFTVPPGSKIILQQAVATCGTLVIGSTNFRKVDYKKPKTIVN